MIALRGEADLQHGSDQRGRYAMPGDIGHKDGYRVLAGSQAVVEIAGHRGHWLITHRDLQSGYARPVTGQDRTLDAPRSGEFLFHFVQLLLSPDRPPRRGEAKSGEENEKADRLDVLSRDGESSVGEDHQSSEYDERPFQPPGSGFLSLLQHQVQYRQGRSADDHVSVEQIGPVELPANTRHRQREQRERNLRPNPDGDGLLPARPEQLAHKERIRDGNQVGQGYFGSIERVCGGEGRGANNEV